MEESELVDMLDVVEDTFSLLKWDAENIAIELIKDFPEMPLRVFASSSEMRMLVLNLMQNAFHAMPDGGQLRVSGKFQGNEIFLMFTDTGVGISPDDLPHIFIPFFTRRADGVSGTGLGLSISKAIVESCNGSLTATSEEGIGSSFTVVLPEASLGEPDV
jgi:signal transduction histidine kinase